MRKDKACKRLEMQGASGRAAHTYRCLHEPENVDHTRTLVLPLGSSPHQLSNSHADNAINCSAPATRYGSRAQSKERQWPFVWRLQTLPCTSTHTSCVEPSASAVLCSALAQLDSILLSHFMPKSRTLSRLIVSRIPMFLEGARIMSLPSASLSQRPLACPLGKAIDGPSSILAPRLARVNGTRSFASLDGARSPVHGLLTTGCTCSR